MSKRRLTLEIDAEDATCGDCKHLRGYVLGIVSRIECRLFRAPLDHMTVGHIDRLPDCLKAESAARPWEGADDDDPTPHHLREKPEGA
jgi:hypothetical protein